MKYSNIYNKVKNVTLAAALLAAGAGSLTSCEDFFNIEPRNEITLENFWDEKSDVEKIIAGCYSGMQSYGMISRMMIWGEFRSENIINNGTIDKDQNLEYILKENITASNPYTAWNEFYNIINRCNTVLKYAPIVAEQDPAYNESELRAHIAEVTAIRSLCYFYLIRTFCDVPYSEEAFLDDNQEIKLPATPFNEVLDKLIVSLESVQNMAVKRYPTSKPMYQSGRITQMTIQALLCEMYLWKKDYANCVKYADMIIEEKTRVALNEGSTEDELIPYNGFPLIPGKSKQGNLYGNAFSQIFAQGNSSESIFELIFTKNNDNMLSNGPYSNFYGAADYTGWVKCSDHVALDVTTGSPKVFVNKYDSRAYETLSFKGTDPVGINKFTNMMGIRIDGTSTPGSATFFSKSNWGVMYPTYGNNHDSRNKSSFIFYRLTDIMLLKAEALIMQMSDESPLTDDDKALREEAFKLIQAVNNRSLLADLKQSSSETYKLSAAKYITKADMTDLVYDEREREFLFEGKRYFDLVRRSQREGNTDYLRSKVKLKSSDNATIVENRMTRMTAIYWPYNLEEIKVNEFLHQNPSFGSGENGNFDKTTNK